MNFKKNEHSNMKILNFDLLNLKFPKGQLISKTNCQTKDSPKKGTNEFIFTSMRCVFVHFLGESSARKKNISRLSDLYIIRFFNVDIMWPKTL